jgi:hypothetical protein
MDLNHMCARVLIFRDCTRLEAIYEFDKNNNEMARRNVINKMHLRISSTMILYNEKFLSFI